MKHKTLYFIIMLICTYSCRSDYVYVEIKEGEVFENKSVLLRDSGVVKLYRVCKDYGPPVNDVCFLVVQKGSKLYKFNPRYRFGLAKDSIFLFKAVSLNYSERGNWVLIDKKNANGELSVNFRYDTIPPVNISLNEKGVFHLKNEGLQKIGELTDYKSLHDLPDIGFYYLSSPGMFYDKVVSIEEMK